MWGTKGPIEFNPSPLIVFCLSFFVYGGGSFGFPADPLPKKTQPKPPKNVVFSALGFLLGPEKRTPPKKLLPKSSSSL